MGSDMDDKWTMSFTHLIRHSDQNLWGNWSLDPTVKPGTIGYIDPTTGSFTAVAQLPGVEIHVERSPSTWNVGSSSVRTIESEVPFDGTYMDPSTGNKVTTGLKVEFDFKDKYSLKSVFSVHGRKYVNGHGVLMKEHFDTFLKEAQGLDKVTADGSIMQGFGMITHTTECDGGLNIGATAANSSLSITGSVEGIHAMTGSHGSVKPSYESISESTSMEKHIFPSESSSVENATVAVAFKFASFAGIGTHVLPGWIRPISYYSVVIDNNHAKVGAYSVNAHFTWVNPDGTNGEHHVGNLTGYRSVSFSDIAVGSTDFKAKFTFVGGGDASFHYDCRDLSSWSTGQRTFDVYGSWPWHVQVKVREESRI